MEGQDILRNEGYEVTLHSPSVGIGPTHILYPCDDSLSLSEVDGIPVLKRPEEDERGFALIQTYSDVVTVTNTYDSPLPASEREGEDWSDHELDPDKHVVLDFPPYNAFRLQLPMPLPMLQITPRVI